MAQIGSQRFSLRGDGPWQGLTTLSKSAPFQFLELEDCYVSKDGSELRMFPGFVCVLDPETPTRSAANDQPFGFIANHVAGRRGFLTATTPYKYEIAVPPERQIIWTRPTTLHCVEMVNHRWQFIGESDFTREPVRRADLTAFVTVVSYDDNGANTELTLDANPLTTAGAFNSLQVNDPITLEGLTGTSSNLLNGKRHVVTVIAANVVTISTNIGAIPAQAGQTGRLDRVTNNAGVGTDVSDDKESLTLWTSVSRGRIDLLDTTVFPAHVANRQRDFGDPTGNLKQGNSNAGTVNGGRSRRRQKPVPFRVVPHVAGNRLIIAAPGYGCVFQAPSVVPPNFDAASESQGVNATCNDVYDMIRCLGVPKAVMWEDPDKAEATSVHVRVEAGPASSAHWGGSDASVSGRNGSYQFKIAYRDDATSEQGLTSEPIKITTGVVSAFEGINLFIYFPGYLVHECLALTVDLYRTQKDGTEFFFDRTITLTGVDAGLGQLAAGSKYGLTPASGTTEFFLHAIFRPSYITDALLATRRTLSSAIPETIEQMPMGCKAARTIRGFTMLGGALGNAGARREMMKGTLTLRYSGEAGGVPMSNFNALNFYPDRVGSAYVDDFSNPIAGSFEGAEEDFGCAAKNIPPAYAGQLIASATLWPFPRKVVRLGKIENTDVGWDGTINPFFNSGRIPDVRYRIVDSPIVPETNLTDTDPQLVTAYIMLPRSRVQISEPDNPGVVDQNVTLLANEQDNDIEAIGDANGQAVLCTRERTYRIAFSDSPTAVPPDIVDDKFGCISANSMVSYDKGCAWLSARGPVIMTGGVEWISAPLEKLFIGEQKRYLQQSDGMMRHSWACADSERGLIYFGMFADRATLAGATPITVNYRGTNYNWTSAGSAVEGGVSAADQIRSRFPCDEILVYSYMTNTWSVWRPPLNIGIQWMARGIDGTGTERVGVLFNDRRFFFLDDAYGQGDKECFQQTVTDTGTLATLSIAPTGVRTWVGLKVAIYKNLSTTDGVPTVLKGQTEIISQTAGTITLAKAVAVENGDTILVGVRSMRLRTTFVNLKDTGTSRTKKVGIRHAMLSRSGQGIAGASAVQQAFVKCVVRSEAQEDGIPTAKESTLTRDDDAPEPDWEWIGRDLPDDAAHDSGFTLGAVGGTSHQVELTIMGGAQVALQDLYTEAE
jgi:hypothetical protein